MEQVRKEQLYEILSDSTSKFSDMKSIQAYSTKTEYLYAMKEDLAEWFNSMYKCSITAENFTGSLENGAILCEHANNVMRAVYEQEESLRNLANSSKPLIMFKQDARAQSFQARDNISNFIKWCRNVVRVREVLMFETDDLILRKNEKNFVLCLLEVARYGSKYGIQVPTIIQLELEIEDEMNKMKELEKQMALGNVDEENELQINIDELHSEKIDNEFDDEDSLENDIKELEDDGPCKEDLLEKSGERRNEDGMQNERHKDQSSQSSSLLTTSMRSSDSSATISSVSSSFSGNDNLTTQVSVDLMPIGKEISPHLDEIVNKKPLGRFCESIEQTLKINQFKPSSIPRSSARKTLSDSSSESVQKSARKNLNNAFLKSLDGEQAGEIVEVAKKLVVDEYETKVGGENAAKVEKKMDIHRHVHQIASRCTCAKKFPVVKIGEGRYRIGNTNNVVFIRILRNHIMVRVGGGWDTLENYLNKHDPCRNYVDLNSSSSVSVNSNSGSCCMNANAIQQIRSQVSKMCCASLDNLSINSSASKNPIFKFATPSRRNRLAQRHSEDHCTEPHSSVNTILLTPIGPSSSISITQLSKSASKYTPQRYRDTSLTKPLKNASENCSASISSSCSNSSTSSISQCTRLTATKHSQLNDSVDFTDAQLVIKRDTHTGKHSIGKIVLPLSKSTENLAGEVHLTTTPRRLTEPYTSCKLTPAPLKAAKQQAQQQRQQTKQLPQQRNK